MPQYNFLTRRLLFKFGLGALVGFGTASAAQSILHNRRLQALDNPHRDFTLTERCSSLKECAQNKGLIYGASARYNQLISDHTFANRFAQEAGLLVPEWELKWATGNIPLRPKPYEFDFRAVDTMAEFAQSHNLLFRGHTLIWHESLPKWFQDVVNHDNAKQIMRHHIETVVGRYAGRMYSWDVVNEAIAYDPRKSKRADCLRQTPWLKFLGPDYIDLAFRTAAAADPKALLVYNDFGVDYSDPMSSTKRQAILDLLKNLKEKGTPIHALGIQAHLQGDSINFNPTLLRQFLREVAKLDLKILITEMDVIDKNLPAAIDIRDRIIAGVYEDYLSVVLDEPAVIAIITWGLSDRYTYLSEFHPRADGKSVRSLPLDTDLKSKLAWNAIARSLSHSPHRS